MGDDSVEATTATADEIGEAAPADADAAKQARKEEIGRYIGMFLMPFLIVGGMIWAYLGGMHSPSPRDMPIAVAGQQAGTFAATLTDADPGAVDVRVVADADEARAQVIDRDVAGAVVIENGTATVYTASAAGMAQANAVTALVTPQITASHLTPAAEDLKPLRAKDSAGMAAMFMTTATVLAGYLPLSIILSNSPQLLFLRRFVPLLAAWGALIAVVIWLVAGPILDVLPSDKAWHAMGVVWLGVVAVGQVQLLFTRLFGPMAVLFAMLLVMFLGMPSSNVSVSIYTVSPFFRFLHSFLPLPQIVEALRAVLYFDGHGARGHIIVLMIGAVVGLALTLLLDFIKTHKTPHPEPIVLTTPSLHAGPRSQSPFWHYATLLFYPLAMVVMMIAMMLGAMHSPAPKNMPVAVVGATQQQGESTADGLDKQLPGMLDIRVLDSAAEARAQVLDRDIVGAFVLPTQENPRATIITNPLAGGSAAQAVEKVFRRVAQAQQMDVVVDAVTTVPNRDSQGTVTMYIAMAWMMAAFMVIIVGANIAPSSRPLPRLLPVVAVYSGFMSAVILIVAGPITGAVEHAGWRMWETGVIAIFCVAMFATVFERLFGMLAVLPVIGVLIFAGVPASNGALSVYMIPPWIRHLNDVLPMAAGVEALRSLFYFDGDTLGDALLTFVSWGIVSLVVVAIIDHVKPVRTEVEYVTAPDPGVLPAVRDRITARGRRSTADQTHREETGGDETGGDETGGEGAQSREQAPGDA